MNKKLLEILACPLCKTHLTLDADKQCLICRIDRLAYPIRDQIPVLLVNEATKLTEEEVKACAK